MASGWHNFIIVLLLNKQTLVWSIELTRASIKEYIMTYKVNFLQMTNFSWCEQRSGQKKKFEAIKGYIQEHRPKGYEDFYFVLKMTRQNIIFAANPDAGDPGKDYTAFEMKSYRQVKEAAKKLTAFIDLMMEATEDINILQDYINEKAYYMFCMTYGRKVLTYKHNFHYPLDLWLKYGYYVVTATYANCLVELITMEATEKLCDEDRLKMFFAKGMTRNKNKSPDFQAFQNFSRSMVEHQEEKHASRAITFAYVGAALFTLVGVIVGIVVFVKLRRRVHDDIQNEDTKIQQAEDVQRDHFSDSD